MNVLIVAEFLGDIENPKSFNSRFLTISDMLVEKGHTVRIVTTDYIHHLKKHVRDVNNYKTSELITLHEPGYKKNVSLQRFYSHFMLSIQLRKWLNQNEKPDVIYCAVPSLDFAYEASKYAKKNKIKFVLDIQDLWPEAFEMVLNIPVFSKIIFMPLRKKADYIYSCANSIVAVSKTYLNRALRINSDCKQTEVVYLGTDIEKFDLYKNSENILIRGDNEILLGYAGTLGRSYDIKTVIDAIKFLEKKEYYKRLKFVVMGDGPQKDEFEKHAKLQGVNVQFLGMLPYPKMVSALCKCDIAINPIRKKSAGTIINKHGDYAAAGIPVINTQESEEYRELVVEWNMGLNCNCEDAKDIAKKIEYLIENLVESKLMGNNARKCAEEKFDRQFTYTKIVKLIELGE